MFCYNKPEVGKKKKTKERTDFFICCLENSSNLMGWQHDYILHKSLYNILAIRKEQTSKIVLACYDILCEMQGIQYEFVQVKTLFFELKDSSL